MKKSVKLQRAMALLVWLNVIDVISTSFGLRLGCFEEQNPLGFYYALSLKLLMMVTLVIWLSFWQKAAASMAVWIALAAAIVVYCAVFMWHVFCWIVYIGGLRG